MCNATTAACDCQNDARCMSREGSFCPVANGPAFAECTRDTNGCYTAGPNQNCTDPNTCSVPGVVATGTACGCPVNGPALGNGCTDRDVGTVAASPADNAVVQCQTVAACRVWRVLVNCAAQSMTAGTIGGQPVCVCKAAGAAPGDAHTLYVDPAPPQAIGMNGDPTGALQPPACRLPSVTAALTAAAATGSTFTHVVAVHESSAIATFSDEVVPLNVPAGVEVTTSEAPSFNTAHFVLALSGDGGAANITLASGAALRGFTIDATGATSSAAVIGTAVDATGTVAFDHLALTSASDNQTAIAIQGAVTATAGQIRITGAGTAIAVARTVAGAAAVAKLTGTGIDATTTQTGARVGVDADAALDSGLRSSLALSASTLTVAGGVGIAIGGGDVTLMQTTVRVNGTTGTLRGVTLAQPSATFTSTGGGVNVPAAGDVMAVDAAAGTVSMNGTGIGLGDMSTAINLSGAGASATLNGFAILVGNGATGVAIAGGTATLTNVQIVAGTGAKGIDLNLGTATLTGGSLTLGGNGSIGVNDVGGMASLSGTAVSVGAASSGIVEQDAAKVTLSGTATANTTLTTTVMGGSTDGDGITINAMSPAAALVILGNTAISKFRNGIIVNDGTVDISGGNVVVSGSTQDGVSFLNQTAGNAYHVSASGVTSQQNAGNGLVVDTVVLTVITSGTFNMNGGDGVVLRRSDSTASATDIFTLRQSTISNNVGRGVAVTGVGQVGATLQTNTVSANGLSGILVSNSSDQEVDMTITGNDVSGNLTQAATADASILGGGVFFSALPAPDAGEATPHNLVLRRFSANKVHANGRNQIAFDVLQKGGSAWNLSGDPTAFDMATLCAAATANSVYCYGAGTSTLGVAIADGQNIPVIIHGMHFQHATPAAGVDYSTQIADDAAADQMSDVSLSCSAITTCN